MGRRNLGESEKGKQRVAKKGADDSTGADDNDWSIPDDMKVADAHDSKFKQQLEDKVTQTMTDLFGSDNQAVKDLNVKYEGYATLSGICGENRLVGMDSCGKEALGIKEHFGIK